MAAIYTGIPTVIGAGEWQAPQVRRVLAPPPTRVRGYAVVAGSIVFRRDLLNKPDNSAAKFRVWDTDERIYQSQAVRRGEEIIHAQVRVSNLHSRARLTRRSVEEERNRHLKDRQMESKGDLTVPELAFPNITDEQAKAVQSLASFGTTVVTESSKLAQYVGRVLGTVPHDAVGVVIGDPGCTADRIDQRSTSTLAIIADATRSGSLATT